MQEYILVPHFYRLNWAKEMSIFLSCSDGFKFDGKMIFGNYKKAAKLRDSYLNSLLEKAKKHSEKMDLFFVNLNDFIFYEKMHELKNAYNIYGFMRGSRFFDSEPGNSSKKNEILNLKNKEIEAMSFVSGLFLGSTSFYNFLIKKNPSVSKIKTKIVGIPIFKKPSYLEKIKQKKENGLMIWNHRLQKQKNPWMIFLLDEDLKENMAVCTPEALSAAYSKEMKLNKNVFKYIVRDNGGKRNLYLDILNKSEYVLSTSEHETWGNSVIEAVMSGAIPILPDGDMCSYKELFDQKFLYPQSWIDKKNKPNTKKTNAKLLSGFIKKIKLDDNLELIKNIQQKLYHKYYCDNWIKNLYFV